MDKLRLRFEKTGRAIYISHLDLMHTMQRAFLRAGVPLKYSEGFNPHPLISILLPLPVGCASVCELMDFRLAGEFDAAAVAERLGAAMPEGIVPLEAYPSERKAKELKWIRVDGVLEYDRAGTAAAAAAAAELFSGNVTVTRRTKRGEGEFALSDWVRDMEFSAGEGAMAVKAVISAQEPTVNPELIAAALRQNLPQFAPDFARFSRVETYDADMKIFR